LRRVIKKKDEKINSSDNAEKERTAMLDKEMLRIQQEKQKSETYSLVNCYVNIKTYHGTYFRAHPGGEGSRIDLQTQPGPWEKFYIVPLQGNKVAFRTCHGTYLRAHPGGEGSKLDLQTQVGPWEQYTIVTLQSNKCAIQSCHGTYFRCHPGGEGSRIDMQVAIGGWEQVEIIKL